MKSDSIIYEVKLFSKLNSENEMALYSRSRFLVMKSDYIIEKSNYFQK